MGKKDFRVGGFKVQDDLGTTPLLLPSPNTNLRAAFDLVMQREGSIPVITAEVDDMSMLRLLAREGTGLVLVPPVVVIGELKCGLLEEAYCFDNL